MKISNPDSVGVDGFIQKFEPKTGTRKEREVFWTDFKTDFDIPVVEATFLGKGNSFFTHRGFLRRFQQLHPEIWRVVQNFGIDRRYTVVGHSLGAAIARGSLNLNLILFYKGII